MRGLVPAFLVCLALLLLAGGARAQSQGIRAPGPVATGFPLSFDSEWIRLHIVGDSLEVRGTYWLVCRLPFESPIPLFYPFPQDSLLGGARMVSGTVHLRSASNPRTADDARYERDAAYSEPLRFETLGGLPGVRWWIPPCTGDTVEVESVYRQQLRSNYARYIVTTTRKWEQPLRCARFEIHLPAGAVPDRFSFPFTEFKDADETFYRYEALSFFPEEDIRVWWSTH